MPRIHSTSTGWLLGLVCILFAAFSSASILSAATATDGWFEVETDHFTFYGTERDELVTVARDLESVRALFVEIFPEATHLSPPTRFYLFPDEASFGPYALDRGVGFFQPHAHAHYGATFSYSQSGGRMVRRQYIHELIHANSPALPLWLRQGLVEVYTHSDVHEGRARIGLRLDNALLGPDLTVASILRTRELPIDQTQARLFIDKSWLLTHYLLIEDPARRQRLSDFVFARLQDPTRTLPDHLGLTPAALDARLDTYLRSDSWPIWVAPPPPEALLAQVRPLASSPVLAHLGDLLLHTGEARRPDAREHAEQALALDSENGLALAVRGRVRHLDGDPADATQVLTQAREHRPDRFEVHYWHGLAELDAIETGDDDKSARVEAALDALRQAVAMDDQHADAWARLGYALTLAEQPSQEAVDALVRARQMLPERSAIALHLVLAHARLGNEDEAQAVVTELERQGVPEGALVQAREIVHQMVFKRAVQLARDGELEAAVERFDQVAAGTTIEALRAQAEANAIKMRRRLELPRQ